MYTRIKGTAFFALAALLLSGCQKLDRPALGDFPQDTNPPGGPLKFFAAFDGTTSNPLMNAVDSIRATFPSDNPLGSIDGVNGKAIQGANKKFIKYAKPNDWAAQAKSFSISFWYRKDGQTRNNTGTNGPEYIASFKSNNGHWSGSSMLLFLEGNNAAGMVKVMIADAAVARARALEQPSADAPASLADVMQVWVMPASLSALMAEPSGNLPGMSGFLPDVSGNLPAPAPSLAALDEDAILAASMLLMRRRKK